MKIIYRVTISHVEFKNSYRTTNAPKVPHGTTFNGVPTQNSCSTLRIELKKKSSTKV